jgi:hypothetical protein
MRVEVNDWLFFIVFGPLVGASLVFCRDGLTSRTKWRSPHLDLDASDRREFARFLRSRERLPEPRLVPTAVGWAHGLLTLPKPCRWDRYLGWAWVFWIVGGTATAVAFGTARDVAVDLIFLDLLLMFLALWRRVRRRAQDVLMAAAAYGFDISAGS